MGGRGEGGWSKTSSLEATMSGPEAPATSGKGCDLHCPGVIFFAAGETHSPAGNPPPKRPKYLTNCRPRIQLRVFVAVGRFFEAHSKVLSHCARGMYCVELIYLLRLWLKGQCHEIFASQFFF